ncbi:MAG: cupin domain-containing protein [Pseudomonadota bacterium]|nr:cupin domain-containing protein [Pseudomonadota bacterium]
MKHVYLIPMLAFTAMAAAAQETGSVTNVQDMKWEDGPPSVPKGGKMVVLHGDPSKDGTFSIRASLPAGYMVPPHFHSKDEHLTVLSGALYIGMSDVVDKKTAHALKAGGFHYLPGKVHHYAFTKAPTVLQISGDGPYDINYLNPADDPRTKK